MQAQPSSRLRKFVHGVLVVGSGVVLALACFLLLPLLRAITAPPKADLIVRSADVAELPPPEAVEDEPEPEPEDEPPPPEVAPEAPPLDLSQLELALAPSFGGGGGGGGFALPTDLLAGALATDLGEMFDLSDLEEQPRPVFRARPQVTRQMRKRMPCTVMILMTVNRDGLVENPVVYSSDDPLFDAPALAAIRQWRFEPGKRNGKPDSFRVRQAITFK